MAKQVKVYDPGREAYYSLDIEEAKKYVATLEQLKKDIKKVEAEE